MNYDSQIAHHYKSYRPALHDIILQDCLTSDTKYNLALDIGCGVGHSTVALVPYCDKIIGIDNSEEMLRLAMQEATIRYEKSNLPELSFADDSVDVMTFAGSLPYCKSQTLLDECRRVLPINGELVVYDFNIDLKDVISALNGSIVTSDYDHEINFDGLDTTSLISLKSNRSRTSIDIELRI